MEDGIMESHRQTVAQSIGAGEERSWAPRGSSDPARVDLELYRAMRRIRSFEEMTRSLFLRGEVFGSVHLCIGQEAVSVGACGAVEPPDLVAATYRGHGHALALGVDPVGLLAEMMGKATGTCGGRAGSMNVVDLGHQLLGCFGIVGGSIAAATGAALSLRRKGGVALAFFGDGAINQGYSYECLNFAKVESLPVVYVCENNQYGEFTPYQDVTAGTILARPAAFDIPTRSVDGNDVWAMRTATLDALAAARSGGGPQFLEALTYRFSDHGRGDPVRYRPEGEMERWQAKDPLVVARERIVSRHAGATEQLSAVDTQVAEEIEAIRSEARSAPLPDPLSGVGEFSEPLRDGRR